MALTISQFYRFLVCIWLSFNGIALPALIPFPVRDNSITLLAFNLAFSQWLAIFPAKHVLMFAVCTFELGSLICGVAPNMNTLIAGRAIAGLGGTGIFNAALMVITEVSTSTVLAAVPSERPSSSRPWLVGSN